MAGGRSRSPDTAVAAGHDPAGTAGRGPRSEPVLRWHDPACAPDGAFAATAVPHAELTAALVPTRGDPWEAVSVFALSYDGHAYWEGGAQLAARALRDWTRQRTLPGDLDELRACLFYEQRRWHHRGEEPFERAAEYVWALLEQLHKVMSARASRAGAPMDSAPVAAHPTESGIRSFWQDDDGYLTWAESHDHGFVVNVDRTVSPRSLVLHRASCPYIGGATGTGRSRTANHRKVCAAEITTLLDWCHLDIGTEPVLCGHCRPASPTA